MAYIHLIHHYDPENGYPTVGPTPGSASVSIFFNGCSKACPLCWNPEALGRKRSLYRPNEEVVEEVLEALDEFFPKDLALLGGDPLENSFEEDFRNNAADTLEILEGVKKERPQTRVICWTGYTWNECLADPLVKEIFEKGLIDILIDGRFIFERKVEGKMYGSSNQRVIDVKKSLLAGEVILIPFL